MIVDESSNFESSNVLTITYVGVPVINSILGVDIFLQVNGEQVLLYSPSSQRTATLSGSGLMNAPNNKLYVYIPEGQVVEIESISNTEAQIPLPVLDPGSKISEVFLSIDKNYFVSYGLGMTTTVEACPEGSY